MAGGHSITLDDLWGAKFLPLGEITLIWYDPETGIYESQPLADAPVVGGLQDEGGNDLELRHVLISEKGLAMLSDLTNEDRANFPPSRPMMRRSRSEW